ncbi:hypothetical protein [Devosia sp. A449]
MSVKLRSIDRWQQLPSGTAIPLPGKRRTVTLQLNVDEPTKFKVLQDKKATLLRVVDPSECPVTVSFAVDGDCAIVAETGNEVWWSSDDGLILSYAVVSQSFTELEQRMEMTPEMEVTILKANIRHEQRLREQAELLLVKQQREDAAAANADPETGEVNETEEPADANAGTPEPAPGAGNTPAP